MIISRTPLRMSFVGGGSDLPSFFKSHGGAVISTSIDKYVYIILKEKFDPGYRISYSITENVPNRDDIKHELFRNALEMFNIDKSLEIVSIADIPSMTGLGSSSSFSVGLLNALNFYKENKEVNNKEFLATKACTLEIEICNSPIGKQDQYAASYGGLKLYEFREDDTVEVKEINCSSKLKEKLNQNILTFYIGGKRSADKILKSQNMDMKKSSKQNNMQKMVNLVWDLKYELESESLDNFGNILHENWMLKKDLTSSIANNEIDEIYETAMNLGAEGGKLLGAGGGGFMIFYVPEESKRLDIKQKLSNLKPIELNFEDKGSCIMDLT